MSDDILAEHDSFLADQCNRLKHGVCTTGSCILRGSQNVAGLRAQLNHTMATCVVLEIYNRLRGK